MWFGLQAQAESKEIVFVASHWGAFNYQVKLILDDQGDQVFVANSTGIWTRVFQGHIDSIPIPDSKEELDWNFLRTLLPAHRQNVLVPSPITWANPLYKFFLQIRSGNTLTVATEHQVFQLPLSMIERTPLTNFAMKGVASHEDNMAWLVALTTPARQRLFLYFNDRNNPTAVEGQIFGKKPLMTMDENQIAIETIGIFPLYDFEIQGLSPEARLNLHRSVEQMKVPLTKREVVDLLTADFDELAHDQYGDEELRQQLKLASETVEYIMTVEFPGISLFAPNSRADDAVHFVARELAKRWLSAKIKSTDIQHLFETSLEAPLVTSSGKCERILSAEKPGKGLRTVMSRLRLIHRALYRKAPEVNSSFTSDL
jgi:hypothetical protein